jgi:secreted PhoX family phosphatase
MTRMTLTRRDLLSRAAAGAGVLATGNVAALLTQQTALAKPSGQPLGPLVPDPAGILDLPAGFSYRILDQVGQPLVGQPGAAVPDRHDGTAAFDAPSDGVYLVRNQEQGGSATVPAVAAPELTYDLAARGGTTTLQLDAAGNVVDAYVSLAGTFNNCAGGATPWGTWLTCEETEQRANATFSRDHGFVFEVDPADRTRNTAPAPLTGLGRFAHEAVVVDPRRGDLYLTEDASNPFGLLYRFRPTDRSGTYGSLRNGGSLFAMKATHRRSHVPDLRVFSVPGTALDVEWVPVADPSAATVSIRRQFTDTQITRSQKFEGAWWSEDKDRAFIVVSFADGAHGGQVWSYRPDARKLRLEVYLSLRDVNLPGEGPDNITVSPYGGMFLAEDGDGVQHLLAVDNAGRMVPFARNARDDSEFAGVCFSPDASTLYANIQSPGITFAIQGPFDTVHG